MPKQTAARSTREEILMVSAQLFARKGYSDVSMREIASAVGIQAPSLYYHFTDKENLYAGVMTYVFGDRMASSLASLQSREGTALERLEHFIAEAITAFSAHPEFLLLLQREHLEGGSAHRTQLVDEVLAKPFEALMDVLKEIAPDRNPYMLAVSVSSLFMFPLETAPMARSFPGWRPEYEKPAQLIEHTCALLRSMLGQAPADAVVALPKSGKRK